MSNQQLSIAFQTDKTPEVYVALAQQINNYDFDVVSVYCDAPYHPSYGPLLLMAPHIQQARLGPAGISPARMPPVDIAANTALLNDTSSGGAYLGIVRGAWLETHGIQPPDKPINAIRETLEIVQMMLSGETGGYRGETYTLAEHVRAPYPLPDEPVPLMVGTWGPQLAAVAGELADEVKIGGSANAAMIPVMQKRIAAGESRAGRKQESVGVVLGAVTVVDEDGEQARELARQEVALYLPVVAELDATMNVDPALLSQIQEYVNTNDKEAAARLISNDLLSRFAFAGTPADIITHCEAIFEAGAHRIEFGTPHGLRAKEGIQLLGEKVLPALRQP